MITKRIALIAALLGVLHNALRILASLGGAPWGFMNYLHGFSLHFAGTQWITVALLAAVIAAAMWFVVHSWNRRPHGAILSSVFWTLPAAVLVSWFLIATSVSADRGYGWFLFAAVPFLTGFQATLALSRSRPITIGDALVVSILTVVALGVLLLAIAVEGAICLVMAAPIAGLLSLLGGIAGYWTSKWNESSHPVTFLLLAGVMPFGSAVEHAVHPPASTFEVTTSIDLAASPEQVWRTVLQPAQLAEPADTLMRSGIGYPRASHIEGSGASAVRYCDFSTGKLVEPVLIWDEPRQLRFRVASNPIPMQEWTPYAHLHPPHLDGFLASKQGEFRLTPLAQGGTRLEATTWYQHNLWPEQYWRVWSDNIIHRIHRMVLENIRDRVTQALSPAASAGESGPR